MDYKELQNELRILFNDDTENIILKENYEDIQKIKSYEYETKKKVRIIIKNCFNNHLNFNNNFLGSPELKIIRQKYYCSISWIGCDNKTAVLFNYEKN